MSAPKKLFIKTYGCQMNVYDSERMAESLGGQGYEETDRAEDADMIIAATDSDETNIVAIQIAYTLFKTPNKIRDIPNIATGIGTLKSLVIALFFLISSDNLG